MRARWEHELRQYEYSLGRPAVASTSSAIFNHELTIDWLAASLSFGSQATGKERRKNTRNRKAKWNTEGNSKWARR